MPEVTLALEVGVLAGGTDLAGLDDAETGVKHATGDWVTTLVGLVGNDFDDGAPQDFFGRRDAELHSYNRHCILLICCASNIFFLSRSVLCEYLWVRSNESFCSTYTD